MNALNVNELLGDVTYAADGVTIESARAASMIWFIEVTGMDVTRLPDVSFGNDYCELQRILLHMSLEQRYGCAGMQENC